MFVNNSKYQVKTPSGWCDFDGIKSTKRNNIVRLAFDNGKTLTTTPEHKLKLVHGQFSYVKNLVIGQILSGDVKIVSISFLDETIDVYDLINVDKGHEYYTNDLVSMNCAWIRDFDEIWAGLSPTFSTGGNAIILSTPNGVGGQYYQLWTEAEAGVNGFNPIKIMWYQHPEHDQEWYDKETRNLPRKKISQEYDCDFIASGDTFLQPADLEGIRTSIVPPIEKVGSNNNIWVWSYPLHDHSYVISADIARGDARDFSAFHVINVETCEVAAEYMGKIPPEKFADVLEEWAKKYNNALIIPENNTFGWFVCTKLRDAGNTRLYYHNNKGNPFDYIPIDPNENPGFPTNQKTRVQILAKLEELIRNRQLKTYSQRLYDQLQAFVWNGSKPMASKDSYDDLIMSLAIGCWLVQGGDVINQQAIAMSWAILNATKVERKDMNQMPGDLQGAQPLVNPSVRGINIYNANTRSQSPTQQTQKQNDSSDFSWLYK